MKVLTILGTRPEIIRLSRVIPRLDAVCKHVVVHTGQNFDPNLDEVFFRELALRKPDYYLGARGTFGEQIGTILTRLEQILVHERPQRFLVLGDTNSSLAAIAAKRLGIPVYHMEAGNRCYDDRVPEEVNRRLIDHSSDVLLPYTERSRQNLLREGIPAERIYVTGNPIYEVLRHYHQEIGRSTVLGDLDLRQDQYFLATMHRAENVDVRERLAGLIAGLDKVQRAYEMPVIISTHPRTRARMAEFRLAVENEHLRFVDPLGFFDFIMLERNARCVLTDSGTVQEECCILKVRNVTLRDVTERPETLERGSNVLAGADAAAILQCVRTVVEQETAWLPPPEYAVEHVSSTVVKVVLGYLHRNGPGQSWGEASQ